MVKKAPHHLKAGFTLVEIIAVLVILSVLAAVAVPKYFDIQRSAEVSALQVALNDMNSRAVTRFSKSMLENDGVAVAADQDTFGDLGLGTTVAINDSYKDFVGTWAFTSDTVVTYTMKNGGGAATVTFTLTPGSSTAPASIAKSE